MEALGNKDEAQAFRWQCFERTLNSAHLRAYLKRLPDFDDLEAEERAMSYALGFRTYIRRWHSWYPGPRWIRPRPSWLSVSLSWTAITTKFCHQRRTRSQPNIHSRRLYSFAR